jgi:hypothetical protein
MVPGGFLVHCTVGKFVFRDKFAPACGAAERCLVKGFCGVASRD